MEDPKANIHAMVNGEWISTNGPIQVPSCGIVELDVEVDQTIKSTVCSVSSMTPADPSLKSRLDNLLTMYSANYKYFDEDVVRDLAVSGGSRSVGIDCIVTSYKIKNNKNMFTSVSVTLQFGSTQQFEFRRIKSSYKFLHTKQFERFSNVRVIYPICQPATANTAVTLPGGFTRKKDLNAAISLEIKIYEAGVTDPIYTVGSDRFIPSKTLTPGKSYSAVVKATDSLSLVPTREFTVTLNVRAAKPRVELFVSTATQEFTAKRIDIATNKDLHFYAFVTNVDPASVKYDWKCKKSGQWINSIISADGTTSDRKKISANSASDGDTISCQISCSAGGKTSATRKVRISYADPKPDYYYVRVNPVDVQNEILNPQFEALFFLEYEDSNGNYASPWDLVAAGATVSIQVYKDVPVNGKTKWVLQKTLNLAETELEAIFTQAGFFQQEKDYLLQISVTGGAVGGGEVEFTTRTGITAVFNFVSKEVTNTLERFTIACKSIDVGDSETYVITYGTIINGIYEYLESRDTCDTFTSTVNMHINVDTKIQVFAYVESEYASKMYSSDLQVKTYTPTVADIANIERKLETTEMDETNMDFIMSTLLLSQESARRNLQTSPVSDDLIAQVSNKVYESVFESQKGNSENGKDDLQLMTKEKRTEMKNNRLKLAKKQLQLCAGRRTKCFDETKLSKIIDVINLEEQNDDAVDVDLTQAPLMCEILNELMECSNEIQPDFAQQRSIYNGLQEAMARVGAKFGFKQKRGQVNVICQDYSCLFELSYFSGKKAETMQKQITSCDNAEVTFSAKMKDEPVTMTATCMNLCGHKSTNQCTINLSSVSVKKNTDSGLTISPNSVTGSQSSINFAGTGDCSLCESDNTESVQNTGGSTCDADSWTSFTLITPTTAPVVQPISMEADQEKEAYKSFSVYMIILFDLFLIMAWITARTIDKKSTLTRPQPVQVQEERSALPPKDQDFVHHRQIEEEKGHHSPDEDMRSGIGLDNEKEMDASNISEPNENSRTEEPELDKGFCARFVSSTKNGHRIFSIFNTKNQNLSRTSRVLIVTLQLFITLAITGVFVKELSSRAAAVSAGIAVNFVLIRLITTAAELVARNSSNVISAKHWAGFGIFWVLIAVLHYASIALTVSMASSNDIGFWAIAFFVSCAVEYLAWESLVTLFRMKKRGSGISTLRPPTV